MVRHQDISQLPPPDRQLVGGLSTSLTRLGESTAWLGAQAPPLRAVLGGGAGRTAGGEGLPRALAGPGRHLLARPFPRELQLQLSGSARLASPRRGFLVRGAPGSGAALVRAKATPPAGRRGRGRWAGGGAGAVAAARRRGPPAALRAHPPLATPLAPPPREPRRGGRGQEAASAPGSAAAGVGVVAAAEPALRAAAAGAGGRDKDDGECRAALVVHRPPTPRGGGLLGGGPKPRIPAAEGSGASAARSCPPRAAGCGLSLRLHFQVWVRFSCSPCLGAFPLHRRDAAAPFRIHAGGRLREPPASPVWQGKEDPPSPQLCGSGSREGGAGEGGEGRVLQVRAGEGRGPLPRIRDARLGRRAGSARGSRRGGSVSARTERDHLPRGARATLTGCCTSACCLGCDFWRRVW